MQFQNPGRDFSRQKDLYYLEFRVLKIKTGDKIYANLILYNFGIFLANEAAKENDKKTRKKSNKYQYSVDISTALKLSRKYFIRKESDKKMDIIGLIAKHVHAVKTEFRQFARPLRGIGAIHFCYR